MYKKISHIETDDDERDVIDELVDRFGDVPKATLRLIDVVRLRVMASKCGINKLSFRNPHLIFETEKPSLEACGELFFKYRGLGFRPGSAGAFQYKLGIGMDALQCAMNIVKDYLELINLSKESAPC